MTHDIENFYGYTDHSYIPCELVKETYSHFQTWVHFDELLSNYVKEIFYVCASWNISYQILLEVFDINHTLTLFRLSFISIFKIDLT